MPFGKFKGEEIEDLPSSYLVFLIEQCDNLKPFLKEEIENELDFRFGKDKNMPAVSKDVKAVYKKLALKYHPDKGGNTMAMQAVNEFYNLLK